MAQAQAKAPKKTADPAGGPDPAELDQNSATEEAGPGEPAELDQDGGPGEAVTTADVAALAGVEPEQAEPDKVAAPPRVFVNEGMRAEIDQKGYTHDPATGRKVTREDLAGVVRGY